MSYPGHRYRRRSRALVLVVCASWLIPGGMGPLGGSSGRTGLISGVATAAENILPLKGLRVPVECYETGQVKVELKAERSDVHENGSMNANGVRVSFFDPTGRVETVVISDGCFFDKKSNKIKSDQPVRMERRGVVITGRGFVWDTASATVRILHDVCVVLDDRLNAMQKGVFTKTGLP